MNEECIYLALIQNYHVFFFLLYARLITNEIVSVRSIQLELITDYFLIDLVMESDAY